MGKAVIMRTDGIVTVNGKNVKPGKIMVDGDVIKTGPESFTAWMGVKDKVQNKMHANYTWTFGFMTNEEMRAEADEKYGGTVPGSQLVATAKRSRDEVAERGFVIMNSTSVAGVKG